MRDHDTHRRAANHVEQIEAAVLRSVWADVKRANLRARLGGHVPFPPHLTYVSRRLSVRRCRGVLQDVADVVLQPYSLPQSSSVPKGLLPDTSTQRQCGKRNHGILV
jgi:hypothetical protein